MMHRRLPKNHVGVRFNALTGVRQAHSVGFFSARLAPSVFSPSWKLHASSSVVLSIRHHTNIPKDSNLPPKVKEETPIERVIREHKEQNLQAPQSSDTASSATPEVAKPKPPLSQRIKEELIHIWHGTKLLGKEIVISSRLLRKLLNGSQLSRREMRQVNAKAQYIFSN
jgi:LETM1 and EF-hand domain-containing protein 1